MPPRPYTTKSRAKRIDLGFLDRSHPFRRARLVLSIALPVVAALVVLAYASLGDHRLYDSGPVAVAHTMFGARCGDCHAATPPVATQRASLFAPVTSFVLQGKSFFIPVSDRACSVCHDGPAHHQRQASTPACASCHFEHKGRERLVDVGDRQCTQCHASLVVDKTRPRESASTIAGFGAGYPDFVAKIPNFEHAHPEFAVTSKDHKRMTLEPGSGPTDTAQVCLDHAFHLKNGLFRKDDAPWYKPGMRGVVDTPQEVRLDCTFCHRPDGTGAYMAPISYATHCKDCHRLQFDTRRFQGDVAPHDTPEIVHAVLHSKYTELAQKEAGKAATPAPSPAPKTEDEPAPPRRKLGTRAAVRDEKVGHGDGDVYAQPRGRVLRGGPATDSAAPQPEEASPRPRGPLRPGKSAEPATSAGGPAPSSTPEDSAAAIAAEWTKASETGLFFKGRESNTCLLCHKLAAGEQDSAAAVSCAQLKATDVDSRIDTVRAALRDAGKQLPVVVPTAIPPRWLPHSRFDHRAHRTLGCVECHGAAKSTKTTDVLLPGVKTCRECHSAAGGARTACVECHRYHERAGEREASGPLTVNQLRHGPTPTVPASSR